MQENEKNLYKRARDNFQVQMELSPFLPNSIERDSRESFFLSSKGRSQFGTFS